MLNNNQKSGGIIENNPFLQRKPDEFLTNALLQTKKPEDKHTSGLYRFNKGNQSYSTNFHDLQSKSTKHSKLNNMNNLFNSVRNSSIENLETLLEAETSSSPMKIYKQFKNDTNKFLNIDSIDDNNYENVVTIKANDKLNYMKENLHKDLGLDTKDKQSIIV